MQTNNFVYRMLPDVFRYDFNQIYPVAQNEMQKALYNYSGFYVHEQTYDNVRLTYVQTYNFFNRSP